ncbi:MAG: PDZ domain-containing protein [Proteobacteria bacterium]|nr:PDZ domain-containing protein [Pseudomonadota bacterium]
MKRSVPVAVGMAAILFGSAQALAQPQGQTLLLRDPALSASHIAFVYAGDIWVADRNGANPRPLTTDGADGSNPVFSPDGAMIAFSATHNQNKDVYVVSVNGGQPKRLTWHPGDDNVLDWAPDGSAVYFASAREFNRGRSAQLYRVPLSGGLPQKQMAARVYRGRFDASGRRFAYDQISPAYDALYGGWFGWRGYRGGRTPSISIMDMTSKTVTKVPGEGVNDLEPMWVGDQVYFLSDRDKGTLNLFHYDPASKAVTKVSHEDVWDIRAAYAYKSVIIYEAGGRLKTLDTANGVTADVPISIHPDLPQTRPQMKDVSTSIQSFDLSPTGKRAAIIARGKVFTVPVDDGSTRTLTDDDSVRDYTALWSPDGSRIAYIDAGGPVQELVIRDQTGLGQLTRFPLGAAYNQLLDWGGDGSRIVYSNQLLELYAINVATGERTLISKSARRSFDQVDTSPDGHWLAYTQPRANSHRAVRLYDFTTKKSYPVTDEMADASSPVFSKDGKYLYFAASTNSGPGAAGLDMSAMEKPYRAGLYVAVLANDGESPLKPKPGDEPPASGEPAAKSGPARIDIEGLERRIEALPVAERNYGGLATAKNGDLYFLRRPQAGAAGGPLAGADPADHALMRFNFATRKDEQVLPGVMAAKISADGWHMLAQTRTGLTALDVRNPAAAKPLNVSSLKVVIDPRKEWRQMFEEAWRMEKEWFYDPNLHGLDWQAIHDRYAPLVAYVGRREDLNTLLREMLGETQVGHQFVYGGDSPKEPSANTGLLGADLALENGHTRIKRIYTGESWNPSSHGPLAAIGLNVREGDYILAVNGRALGAGDEIWEHLQGTAGKQTALKIASSPDGHDARTITVEPVASENELRLAAWVEDNRRAVDKATNGRVGYVYVPNTQEAGFNAFNRMFYAQIDKDALIVDDRSNDGGSAANYIVDVLSQPPLAGWEGFAGDTFNTPGAAMFGPKVLLVDQDAQSGGDFLAYAFKQRKIGPLIGTRTWGGLIGVSGNPTLVDGGLALVPWYRFFDADGHWTVEGMGVSPDIRVELDPLAINNGHDTQLQAAIAEVQRELATNPPARGLAPKPPPYPTKVGPPSGS